MVSLYFKDSNDPVDAYEVNYQHRFLFVEKNSRSRRRPTPSRKPQVRHDPRQPELEATAACAQGFQVDVRAQHTSYDVGHGRRRVRDQPVLTLLSDNLADR